MPPTVPLAQAAAEHAQRCARAAASLRASEGAVRLRKSGSNLFRDRGPAPRQRLDLRDFDHLLAVDPDGAWVEAEAGMSYEALVDALLPLGLVPTVVPQLKGITVGGAVAGVGIEASAFRHGLVHDGLLAVELLLADGERVRCTPDNEHAALFRGFPNSYGTLGYALALRLRVRPARPFVTIEHRRFQHPQAFWAAMAQACQDPRLDYVDGVVFGPNCAVLTLAWQVDKVPYCSDYRGAAIYYRSLLKQRFDHLRLRDWLWRWDTDWFWCSKRFGAENPWVRRLLGPRWLGSRTYQRWMRWASRLGINHAGAWWRGRQAESVIQDVDIPIEQADEFLGFLLREVGLLPIWVCPLVEPPNAAGPWPLYPLQPGRLYLNFGFWGVVEHLQPQAPGALNRRIEAQTLHAGGLKSLYSETHFAPERFAQLYGGSAYADLKARYDPRQRLPDLYSKCVLRC